MEIILRRYGNSTVVVLPPPVLKDLGLIVGQAMALDTTPDGKIMLSRKPKYTLEALVAACDLNAPQPEDLLLWDNAPASGQEEW